MGYLEIFFVIMQVEFLIIMILLIYLVAVEHKKRHQKPDQLLRYFKEYIAEGYTFGQAREKLAKIGFDKERIESVVSDFKKH